MTVLQPNEYDASYFDGAEQTLRHNAGYSRYRRWFRMQGVDSQGEHYKDIAKTLFDKYELNGKKVLEIGCAKGFVVKDLRDFGSDAFGIDVSQYAVDEAESGMNSFLTVADAKTHLKTYQAKEFDFVFSLRFFECLTDIELDDLIPDINRISKQQYHRFGVSEKVDFYENRDTTTLLSKSFQKGTDLSTSVNLNDSVTK